MKKALDQIEYNNKKAKQTVKSKGKEKKLDANTLANFKHSLKGKKTLSEKQYRSIGEPVMNYVKEVSFHHKELEELGIYHNSKFIAFFTDLAVNTQNPHAESLSLPVVDRFAHLLISLAKPDAYKMTPYLE